MILKLFAQSDGRKKFFLRSRTVIAQVMAMLTILSTTTEITDILPDSWVKAIVAVCAIYGIYTRMKTADGLSLT